MNVDEIQTDDATVYCVNSRFQDVEWDELPTPDRAFTDIPMEVYDRETHHNPYGGTPRFHIDEYEDEEFPVREFMDVHRTVLPANGLALVNRATHQAERVVAEARRCGFKADYGHSIVLYFVGMAGLPAKNYLVQNRYDVQVIEGPDHEYRYENVKNAIPYPRRHRAVGWHPCPFERKPLETMMEGFGGETWVDFCAGTGATGLVAVDLGYDCILVEKDDEYYGKMVDRLRQYIQQDASRW